MAANNGEWLMVGNVISWPSVYACLSVCTCVCVSLLVLWANFNLIMLLALAYEKKAQSKRELN